MAVGRRPKVTSLAGCNSSNPAKLILIQVIGDKMKLENLIRNQKPFKKGLIVGYIGDRNYYVYVDKLLILELTKSGLVVWFDNDYHSKITSKVQNVICKLVKIPKKRDTFGNYKVPEEKWHGTNIAKLSKIKNE